MGHLVWDKRHFAGGWAAGWKGWAGARSFIRLLRGGPWRRRVKRCRLTAKRPKPKDFLEETRVRRIKRGRRSMQQ